MKIPHPWWHIFFTSCTFVTAYGYPPQSYREYRCAKCKKEYRVLLKNNDYETVVLDET